MSTRLTPFVLVLGLVAPLVACGDKEPEETGSAPDLDTDSDTETEECSGTAPVIEEVSCENSGIQPHYETGEDTVTLTIRAETSDADGDLDFYTFELFYDEDVDGSIDTSSSPFSPSSGAVDVDECEAGLVSLGTVLYLAGGDPAFDTLYEWGVVVTDGAGLQSEVGIVECYTPKSTGEDGGEETSDSGG